MLLKDYFFEEDVHVILFMHVSKWVKRLIFACLLGIQFAQRLLFNSCKLQVIILGLIRLQDQTIVLRLLRVHTADFCFFFRCFPQLPWRYLNRYFVFSKSHTFIDIFHKFSPHWPKLVDTNVAQRGVCWTVYLVTGVSCFVRQNNSRLKINKYLQQLIKKMVWLCLETNQINMVVQMFWKV